MDVTDRDDGDAGDGDDELTVFLDALDVAFGALVDAVDHAYAVARVVLRRVGTEVLDVASGVRRGDEDEGSHLVVADGAGDVVSVRVFDGVVHEVLVVRLLELPEPVFGTADEEDRRDELLLDVAELAFVVFFDRVDRDVGLNARRDDGLEIDHAVVEHFECVPVEAFGGRFCKGHFFHSPACVENVVPGRVRIDGIGPRGSRAPIQEPVLQSCCVRILSRILYKYKNSNNSSLYQI